MNSSLSKNDFKYRISSFKFIWIHFWDTIIIISSIAIIIVIIQHPVSILALIGQSHMDLTKQKLWQASDFVFGKIFIVGCLSTCQSHHSFISMPFARHQHTYGYIWHGFFHGWIPFEMSTLQFALDVFLSWNQHKRLSRPNNQKNWWKVSWFIRTMSQRTGPYFK